MRPRPWVAKFESGEYLREWKGFDPIYIGGLYSDPIDIGEEKFIHCIGDYSGIGDVSWWITEELDKLSEEELIELEQICAYKKYVTKNISRDAIEKISNFYNCESHHIYRLGTKELLKMFNVIKKYYYIIKDESRNDTGLKANDHFNDFIKLIDLKDFDTFKSEYKPKK